MRRRHLAALAVSALLASTACTSALSQQAPRIYHFDVPAQPLKYALRAVTRAAGLDLSAAAGDLAGKNSHNLLGDMPVQDALDKLLAGSGLTAQIDGGNVLIRGRSDQGINPPPPPAPEIIVTGTHLKGVPPSSPVITLTTAQMRDQGQTSLAEALRQLPQNYGGGQNPGVGFGVPGGQNASGASTINLRGVGGDATLTLLNGHRLAYDANLQSIDISTIPFLAIDRIEIVPDGSSALYGSDAVAGVANVILRRDYQGVLTDFRIGGAPDGGALQQQYGILAGTRWSSGGFAATYEFSRETPVNADDRSYARFSSPGLDLTPFLKHHDAALTVHQSVTHDVTFSLDAIANIRWNAYRFAEDERGDYLANGGRDASITKTFAVAPSLDWDISPTWSANITGMFGLDRNRFQSDTFVGGQSISTTRFCNCNQARSIEAGTTGSILQLPGGALKVALGGGFRSNRFTETDADLHASQDVAYLYGEADLPIVSAENARPFLARLSLSGAGRFESYRHGAQVATPKLGVIYSPAHGLTLRGSWGRSFKAPTLFQEHTATRVALFPAFYLGGPQGPSTAILLLGGRANLRPERAETWSTGITWTPPAIHDLTVSATYFHIDYRQRVVSPITYTTIALTNQAYSSFVSQAPSAAEIAEALAAGPLINVTGAPIDPGSITAIVDNRYVNAGRQRLQGVDVEVSYTLALGGDHVALSGSAAYLRSNQRITSSQAVQTLAGTLFNPPHLRSRAGAVWSHKAAQFSAFLNYSGSLKDERSAPTIRVHSMTTLDISGRLISSAHSGLSSGLEVGVEVQNLLNQRPPLIVGNTIDEPPYDSSNYSPVGRLISFSVRKRW